MHLHPVSGESWKTRKITRKGRIYSLRARKKPIRNILEKLRFHLARPVELAYLESASPTIEEICATMMDEHGVERIRIIPIFLSEGSHVKRDLPVKLEELRKTFPSLRFETAPVLGVHPGVQDALVSAAIDSLR
jgi:sirohydrochlorin cobaltochelatase